MYQNVEMCITDHRSKEGGVAVASRKGVTPDVRRYKTMKIDQQISLDMIDDDYKQFVEKFKPKKTTDDCYTPENVFTAVVEWAREEYGIDPAKLIRPFWPGGGLRENDLSGRVCGSG